MSYINTEYQQDVAIITIERADKHNAFDDILLKQLQSCIETIDKNTDINILVIKAQGKHFSAGADLAWMQKMIAYDEQQNHDDAMILANLMSTLYHCSKLTVAVVQGSTFGGGVGIIAACDIAIAASDANFCFSEVKLGLIPAVISPYVINAIGARQAQFLFMTGTTFNAAEAQQYNLIHFSVLKEDLWSFTLSYLQQLKVLAPQAMLAAKSLVRQVANRPIDNQLANDTAALIAKKRISTEGQLGLQAFLNKEKMPWA